ncbi:Excinuclease ABC subunit A [Paludibacter propionicigenes WB4]|uniref:UvrABC system protein A n=1 Tax=Paludibacter propionicigenes (strain DSM 17365 / JCM 13257 / WB4) TaxID=694427 RepID=E4T5N8_PALPW|nr:excinuclease ABC subunit UvrA [Paludibacter propionicigenes]ADQ80032.1 Excinuclease ABC subunit A [Paludibacter propionicigenes WB4]
MSKQGNIIIKGARVHNLKNIDVEIPRNKLVVITGLSGSGKSSLAFDTLYAEGQRRYVESLSAYARQFLGRMSKPEVDYIKGIPPAIAIEQKVNSRNPRSTVGTSTEIYEYIKLLYARIGKTYSPVSGELVRKHEAQDVIDAAMDFADGTKLMVLTPVIPTGDRTLGEQLQSLLLQGFSRLDINGETVQISDAIKNTISPNDADKVYLLIDRLVVEHTQTAISRLTDSIETAFSEGGGVCVLKVFADEEPKLLYFSKKFEADGMTFETPTVHTFSFNSPIGACPVCEGFGKVIGIDEDLVVPNKTLSIFEDAVVCWKGEVMSEWKKALIRSASKFNFPIHKPYYELTDEQRHLLWTGNKYFEGLNAFFKHLESNQYKIQYRVMLARYRGKTICPECNGSRLKKEASYIRIADKSISELVLMSVAKLNEFFDNIQLDEQDAAVAKRLLLEITNRIHFLLDVGLGYLTLNRLSNSLSGGESQRINLATSLGSSLVGSLYILDEPSIGLHSRDTHLLIKVLKQLRELGNTVVVVEHDEEIMRAADYLIDIGPNAGRLGGKVVFQGVPDLTGKGDAVLTAADMENSYTLKYLSGQEKIEVPAQRRKWSNFIEVIGARENNLKGINVKFPLNVMTVVTGVSGSGKSSLVKSVFYAALKKHYGGVADRTGQFGTLKGSMHLAKDIEFVDQNPIGRSSRSNPVTYIKAYDEIRKLFADQQLSKQMNYSASHFSFNTEGGRCEECQGEGTVTVEMQFMADLVLECEHCHGKRFKQDILDVQYKGANIFDVLEMTVNQAIEFFSAQTGNTEKKIVKRLKPLQDVGVGYVKLGQSSSTLSGGESQRVKLASFLANEKPEPTIFVFDEPTTGLHFHDIKTLMKAFDALIAKGHTVIIIEHNIEVIKCADHIIDIGPDGGDKGGNLVFEGTPENIINCEASYTGMFLKDKM